MLKSLVAVGGCLLIAGCTISIDEGSVFRPREIGAKAVSAADMRLSSEGEIAGDVAHALVDTSAGRIAVTYIATRQRRSATPLILACMGNASDRVKDGAGYARKMLPHGDVMLFDYPGYGDSTGKPDVESLLSVRSPLLAEAEKFAEGRPILLWGHSLGGFICAQMAASSPRIAGIVLETTVTNADEVADAWKPWYLPFISIDVAEGLASFDTVDALKDRGLPALVIGAGKDKTLPVRLHRSLAEKLEAAGVEVTYLEYSKAGHWDAPLADSFAADAAAFFTSASGGSN